MTHTKIKPENKIEVIAEHKLTLIRPGFWRNRFRFSQPLHDYVTVHDVVHLGDGTYLTDEFYISKEAAEQDALGPWPEEEYWDDPYLGSIFFPDEEPK